MSLKKKALDRLKGRTIKNVEVSDVESSDSCRYVSFQLFFEDGSQFSMEIHSLPKVTSQFFRSAKDGDEERDVVLVKPR